LIETVTSFEALAALAGEWNELAGPDSLPVMRHEWFLSSVGSIHPESELRILVLRSGGAVRAIAPMALSGRLACMGVSSLYEPCDLLYDSEESLKELLAALRRCGRTVVLQRLPGSSGTAAALDGLRAVVLRRPSTSSLYVDCSGSWEEYYSSISSRRRYDLRRARRRAEEHGEVGVEILRPTPQEFHDRLPDLIEVEAAGWKGRRGSAMKENERLRRFFSSYGEIAARQEMLTLSFLRIGDRHAAAQLGVELGGRLWVLKIGYDECWARCSPGMQLTHEMVRYSFERGLSRYELLGAEEPWQRVWANGEREYLTAVLYPMNPSGMANLAADGAAALLRMIRRAAPRPRQAPGR
jgi:CelD/BcsL family acetyltransferase involved in cellulose biosynthesis